jgi:mannosyl-3-phosphoglycerate phosphatase family protein
MRLVFTDLDGTLLHPDTYTCAPAGPAIDALRRKQIPLILCTSKTRAEVEFWRQVLGNHDPFIVENGGAVYIPAGYFPTRPAEAMERSGYDVIEMGMPYAGLVKALREAAEESGCRVRGFADMTAAEVSERTGLPLEQAERAKRREYDEPFEILGTGAYGLLAALERRGIEWTRGDRFYHVTGHNDKAAAVRRVIEIYKGAFGEPDTIGIGDGHNDAGFLAAVDTPIVVRSRFAAVLKKAVPRSLVTRWPGPRGWNEAVLALVSA